MERLKKVLLVLKKDPAVAVVLPPILPTCCLCKGQQRTTMVRSFVFLSFLFCVYIQNIYFSCLLVFWFSFFLSFFLSFFVSCISLLAFCLPPPSFRLCLPLRHFFFFCGTNHAHFKSCLFLARREVRQNLPANFPVLTCKPAFSPFSVPISVLQSRFQEVDSEPIS